LAAGGRQWAPPEVTSRAAGSCARGSFSRAVTLPAEVKQDAITATCDNGVCTLRALKAKKEKVGKKVEIE